MVCNGLAEPAEGILNAGFDLARSLGAVLACRCWSGRWLGQPCAGLVGSWAGFVALGAVEAIVQVWMYGVGHGDHPGSRSDRRPGRRQDPGGLRDAGPGSDTLCLLPGRVDPVGDVTSQ